MFDAAEYGEFLRSKVRVIRPVGFEPDRLSAHLFDFQKDIAAWALRKGRAAVFAGTGLGKSAIQLEWAHRVHKQTGNDVIILAPLAVAGQTAREGDKFGLSVNIAASASEIRPGVNITNYEKLDAFELSRFGGVVLDESSILKAFDGKTCRSIIEAFANTPYKLACTATPAPNDYMELGTHAEFLGVMSRAEMLAMYFVHDSGDTSKWRVKGHAKGIFWEWVSSWATMITMPSDLGYEDRAFKLPALNIEQVTIATGGDPESYKGLTGSRAARKETLEARCQKAAEIAASKPNEPWLIWCDLNDESKLLTELIPGAVEIKGSDKPTHKESAMLGFSSGAVRLLVTKPSIAGFGMNWQHCANVIFVGLSHSFEEYYQAVRRCYRFGQEKAVNVWIVTADIEGSVVENIKRKETDFREMQRQMISQTQELTKKNVRDVKVLRSEYKTAIEAGTFWTMQLGDCVESLAEVQSDSVHYSIFSPPFASLYTYSDSERDMGNCLNETQFYEHMGFLAKQLARVTMPGRNLSFHCMNLPSTKSRDGFIGIKDFRGDLIRIFQDAGFIYHSEVTIWKDPVTAMQRTKAIGLLHKQLKKDSCISRQGIPDYLVTMRKPGDNPERVTHSNETFPVSEWQEYASPVWMDIKQSKTLQHRSARQAEDERHICPLQLEVIERALRLWSNEGDLVLSPFAGIGSEGYVAVSMGRRFRGIELKQSYFEQAVANLKAVESERLTCLFPEL